MNPIILAAIIGSSSAPVSQQHPYDSAWSAYDSNHGSARLVALEARHRIPTSHSRKEFAEAGGLITYGASVDDVFQQAGIYVGRLLKGEKPADLPVLQPT